MYLSKDTIPGEVPQALAMTKLSCALHPSLLLKIEDLDYTELAIGLKEYYHIHSHWAVPIFSNTVWSRQILELSVLN